MQSIRLKPLLYVYILIVLTRSSFLSHVLPLSLLCRTTPHTNDQYHVCACVCVCVCVCLFA